MTREEKSNLLNELLEYEEKNDIGNLTRAERREFQQWVSKALEQEPIIDKIKAEIETDLSFFCFDDWGNETTEWKEVKAIIDKYRAESEGKE